MVYRLINCFSILGLFNASDKFLAGMDILLEWREFFKSGVPPTIFISTKFQSLLMGVEEVSFLTINARYWQNRKTLK